MSAQIARLFTVIPKVDDTETWATRLRWEEGHRNIRAWKVESNPNRCQALAYFCMMDR